MGTRGFLGFVVDGVEKITYNQFDSYPSGLGRDVLRWLRFAATDIPSLREKVAALRVVDEDSEPTEDDVKWLSEFADLNVSAKDPREWYALLRETQGNPSAILQAAVLIDGSDFPMNSLFCEWGYLVDFDAQMFEAYRGFQQSPHSRGRFARRGGERHGGLIGGGYHPVALTRSWPLADLPSDEAFLSALREDGDE